jgi:hypothetical protein
MRCEFTAPHLAFTSAALLGSIARQCLTDCGQPGHWDAGTMAVVHIERA